MGTHGVSFIRRRWLRRVVAASILVLPGLWGTVIAQETTGSIEGVISGPDGKPLAGVEVIATLSALKVARSATSNRDGVFRITALPLGEYEVFVQHPGFQPVMVRSLIVRLGRSTAVPPLTLAATGELVEYVEVVAEAPLIDPSTTTTGGNIAADVFDNLPVTRDYQSIAALLPNVSVSYLNDPVNFSGATGIENRYFLDGIDMTDPARGYGGTLLPPDFVQEVEVKTGGYEAEYRSALGGMVNVVTPSGSDRLAGKLIGYWTSHLVSEEPKLSSLELQQKDFAQYDVGFSLSGPMVKERAWFYVAYNPQKQRVDTEIPGLDYYPDSTTTHRFAGKVDWQVNGSNRLAFTVVGDPASRDGVGMLPASTGVTPVSFVNPDPYLRHIESGGVGMSLRGTHVLGPHVLLETALSNQRREDVNLPGTGVASDELLIDVPTGTWSGGSCCWLDNTNSQWTAAAKATWALGRHEVKGGFEYRENAEDYGQLRNEWLLRFSEDSFLAFRMQAEGTVKNRIASLFAQDSWRIGARWVVNGGVRWTREEYVGASGSVVQSINNEWQPRVGFVYLPGGTATQRLYGSAARYYQELSSRALFFYAGGEGFWRSCAYDHDPRQDPSGGDCLDVPIGPQPEVPSLRGQYTDEYSLGYQRQLGVRHRIGIRGVYRSLGDAVEDGLVTSTGAFVWGNPGRGPLAADYPRATRVYKALEFTVEGRPTPRSGYLASYVLSENRGNYPGLYNTDFDYSNPNTNGSFDVPDTLVDGDGLLPNDRTHVVKGSGFHGFASGLNVGASLLWQSGTPLNEFGGSAYGIPWLTFLRQRGTAGRTPSILDLSLRVDYTLLRNAPGRWKPRLILDVYHLFGGRKAVDYDQVHYFNQDPGGNQIDPNPSYGMASRYYPPTTARLGLEVTF